MEDKGHFEAAIQLVEDVIDTVSVPYRESAYGALLRAALEATATGAPVANAALADSTPRRELLSRPVNELMARIRPRSMTDQALLVGAHADHIGQAVGVGVVREGFRAARTKIPANIADVLARLVGQGLLMDVEAEGPTRTYKLTVLGWDRIDEWLEEASVGS